MEKIAEYVLNDEFPAKQLLVCASPSLAELPFALTSLGSPFVLFIAADTTTLGEQTVFEVGEKLLRHGMIYACVWGPDCERLHDLLDVAIVKRNPSETVADVVPTTWHSKDSLEDAVSFFMYCAWPAAAYERTCSSWVAAVIGCPAWEKSVKEAILANGVD